MLQPQPCLLRPPACRCEKCGLDAFEPDFLVAEDPGLADGLDYEKNRILLTSDLIRQDRYAPFSHGIGVHELFDRMWEEDFQYVKREPPEIVLPRAGDLGFRPLVAACFGEYPGKAAEEPDFEARFRRVFAAKDLSISADELLRLHIEPVGFPLSMGISHLRPIRRGWRIDPLLYLLNPTSALDLVDFWNLRALGMNPVPIPLPYFDELRSRLASLVARAHRPHPYNPSLMLRTTAIPGRSLQGDDVQAYAEKLKADCPRGLSMEGWYPRLWDSFGRAHDHAHRAEVVASGDEEEIVLTGERLTFRACPLPIEPNVSPHRRVDSVRVIRVRDYLGGSGVASVTPPDLKSARDVVGLLPLEDVWFSSEGIVTTSQGTNSRFLWRLPRGPEVCRAWLAQYGFGLEVTSGGKLMLQAVRALGGLENTRILAEEPLAGLLNRMTGLPDRPRKTYNNPKMVGKLKTITGNEGSARGLLRTLLERQVLEVGVRLRCEHCGQKNWYALDAMAHSLQCHRCLQDFAFPAAQPPDVPWYYRTVGAFAVEDYIQGALSVILAMRLIGNIGAGPSWNRRTWCPSFNLTRNSNGYKCEVDAMGFVAQSEPYMGAVLPVFG